jgi:hypothetical protein
MAVADRHGLPIAVWTTSGERHETQLVHDTLAARFVRDAMLADIESGKVVAVNGITAAQWGHPWLRKYRLGNRNYKTDVSRFDTHVNTAEWARKALVTERYSTVAQVEQRESIGKVLALMTAGTEPEASGAPSGAPTPASGAPDGETVQKGE